MQPLSILILAAGKGERMKSNLPKVLHPLAGRPLLAYVLETARQLKPQSIRVVVGHGAEQVKNAFVGAKLHWVLQQRQLGTADAVRIALKSRPAIKGPLLILYGDVPLLTPAILRSMQERFVQQQPALVFLTAMLDNPTGYGRVVRDRQGRVQRIVEEKEATVEEKKIGEVNTGIYLAHADEIKESLNEIGKSAVGKEYYLTDLIETLLQRGKQVVAVSTSDVGDCFGVNSREDLAVAEDRLRCRILQKWIRAGVTVRHPDSTWIGPEVILEPDVEIHPGVIIEGKSHVGAGTKLFAYSVIEESRIGRGARIGPFAHLRPGSVVGDEAHVGNFVELKKTVLKKGVKANHLSYLGDALIGEGTNVGAGTITCNYDGFKKHKTVLGKNVFVGSDVQLVAPVKVENGAWIAAGTTVTQKVPAGSLAISRVGQENIKGWVSKRIVRQKGR